MATDGPYPGPNGARSQYNVSKFTHLLACALCIALGLAGMAVAQGQGSDAARDAHRRAVELQRKGDLEGALRELDRAVEVSPGSAAAWFNRGLARRALKDCRAAVKDFARALELRPDFFNALYQRGNCRQALGSSQLAIEDYSRAAALPGRIDARFLAYFGRADAYRRLGRLEEADADYTQVIAMRTDTTALRSRAWVRFYRGLWSEAFADAARHLHETEGKEPDAAYSLILGVLALRRGGDMQQARKFLNEWGARVKADPWPGAILAYLDTGADAALLAVASNPAETTEARAYVGSNLLALRQVPRGVELLRQVVRDGDPSYLEYDLAYHELRRLGLVSPAEHKRRPPS
jgi:tetratricopeptide (TPR) repeat protein